MRANFRGIAKRIRPQGIMRAPTPNSNSQPDYTIRYMVTGLVQRNRQYPSYMTLLRQLP